MKRWAIKQRYIVQFAVGSGVIGLAAVGVVWSMPAEASLKASRAKQAGPVESASAAAEDKVEASVYSRVVRLRRDIAMTNQDLAALGLTQAQSEDVLTRLVEWVESNRQPLIQAENGVESARQQLVELERRVRVGEASEQDAQALEGLYSAVIQSEALCNALYEQAGSHAIAPASAGVRSRWETARRYSYLPPAIRHLPGLDAGLVNNLLEAVSASQAGSPGSFAGGAALTEALPSSSRQAMNEVAERIRANLPGVRLAELEVLPVPVELRDEDLGMSVEDETVGH